MRSTWSRRSWRGERTQRSATAFALGAGYGVRTDSTRSLAKAVSRRGSN